MVGKRNRLIAMTLVLGAAFLGGCSDRESPVQDSAEVPQPGSAVDESEDIGPPPGGQSEPPLEVPSIDQEEDTGDATGADASGDVTVSLTTWDDLQEFIAAKQGRIVVLDLWSTTCVPCRREFPNLVELHRKWGDEVACISYSLDYSGRASRPPESYREVVMEFLAEQEANFDNFLSTDDPDELHERLNLAAIPAVYVFDRSGELRHRFDNEDPDAGEFTYEADVIPLVKDLLAEK